MSKRKRPIIIGIAGGSGSGKTTIAQKIHKSLPEDRVLIMTQDSYYKDHKEMTKEERDQINFDHPDAFDTKLLVAQLKQLLNGQAIEMPIYDFPTHLRSDKTIHVEPADIIILEGILVLADERLRDLMSIKVYVDTDDDIRLIRREKRDMKERGYDLDYIISQYLTTVKPMYNQFIDPSKRYADIIVPEGGENNVAIDMLSTKIRSVLHENDVSLS
ncbi:MAG: uridine kinase [Lactobacillus sp.]|jgi:uridine kinase